MPELSHELHLLHDVPGNVLLLVEVKLLDADKVTAILSSLQIPNKLSKILKNKKISKQALDLTRW